MKNVANFEGWKRFIRIFLPFLLLLLGFFAYLNIWNTNNQVENFVIAPSEFETATPFPVLTKTTRPQSPTATPIPSLQDLNPGAEATRSALIRNLSEANLEIKGPPANSVFTMDSPITIYWTWSTPLIDDHFQFSIFLLSEFEEWLIGTSEDPSLGNYGYHINFTPNEILQSPGQYDIEIRLIQIAANDIVLRSENVPIMLK